MFSYINFDLIKNIPWRTRLIVLASLGGVFLFLILFFVWRSFFADRLISFVPENSLAYVHFSVPVTKQSDGFNNMLSLVLSQNNLADFPLIDLKREASFIILPNASSTKLEVLLKIKHKKDLNIFLNSKGVKYSYLNGDTVLIYTEDGDVSLFKKNDLPKLNKIIGGKLKKFSSLNIYAKKDLMNYLSNDFSSWLSLIINLKNQNTVFVSANVQKDGSLLIGKNQKVDYMHLLPPDRLDLVLSGDSFNKFFSSWSENLKNFSVDDNNWWQNEDLAQFKNIYSSNASSTEFLNKISAQKFKFAFQNSSDLMNNQDLVAWPLNGSFYLELNWPETKISDSDTQQLDNFLATMLASKFPKQSQISLSDDTKVIILKQETGKISFVDKDGTREAIYPDQSGLLAYKLVNGKLVITNKAEWLNWQLPDYGSNYAFINTSLWPSDGFLAYLKQFKLVEVVNGSLILR